MNKVCRHNEVNVLVADDECAIAGSMASDVAIHKHCKKMGISLPGRAYWQRRPARSSRAE